MQESPGMIVVVTATVGGYADKVHEALRHGALAAVPTPILKGGELLAADLLLAKLDELEAGPGHRVQTAARRYPGGTGAPRCLVAIGASAGGPGALARVLSDLPAMSPAVFVIVQHIDSQFAAGMAEWLGRQTKIPVRLAGDDMLLTEGAALIANGDRHLILRSANTLGYTSEPRDVAYRPSIDVLFHSVLENWEGPAVGVLLTGMGKDGARGLKALRTAGNLTIAQDAGTSMIYGMPKAAAELDAAVSILPLGKIGPAIGTHLTQIVNGR
jgi:chemotaxis response regulator CheB